MRTAHFQHHKTRPQASPTPDVGRFHVRVRLATRVCAGRVWHLDRKREKEKNARKRSNLGRWRKLKAALRGGGMEQH